MAENPSASGASVNNPAASASSASRSNSTADSYIGSLISLTSKSEIRYEGVLYNINTEESSIGLKNVRSFGTEGRKKDGPQIPPGDKVYEYILFRGSDIKDLQVKSSPPVQPTPPINNDPAIIQSHYPRPVSTSASLPSAATGPLTDHGPHNAQMGPPGSSFQGGVPLYQPGGNMGAWGASPPPPSANGSGLAMPMYWQGYYGPPTGLPHLHQQSLLRPPPGLAMTPSMQQPLQYPNFNAPLPTGAPNLIPSNLPVSTLPVSQPDAPSSLLPASMSSLNFTSAPSASSILPTTVSMAPSATIASETLPSSLPNKAAGSSLPVVNLGANLPSLSPLPTSIPELNATMPPISNKANATTGQTIPYQSVVQSTASGVVALNPLRTDAPTPSLVTPGQLLQLGSATAPSSQPLQTVTKVPSSQPLQTATKVPSSQPLQTTTKVSPSQPLQTAHKDVEVVQVLSSSSSAEPLVPVTTEAQPPILPLPVPSRASHKPNGAPFHSRHGYRGRGRGTGSSRPVTKFTEDFDFMAMNEKFKKDEVWGHLGKNNKSHSMDREDGNVSGEDDPLDEDELVKIEAKPVYNKDDFFDSLSCNTLDNDPQNGRTRFSEQMKIDTETFGEFSRYRGGRGGRGPPRGGGGRSRGSYYGRGYGYGYGYAGRGRGRAIPGRGP